MRALLAVMLTGCAGAGAHSDVFLEVQMDQPALTRTSTGNDVISGATGHDLSQRFIQWDDQWRGHPLTWQLTVRMVPGTVAKFGSETAAFHYLDGALDCEGATGRGDWTQDDLIAFDVQCPDGTPISGVLFGRLVGAERSSE